MLGFSLLGIWVFILYIALCEKIADVKRKIDILLEEMEDEE